MKAKELALLDCMRRLRTALTCAVLLGIFPFVYAQQPEDLSSLTRAIEEIKQDYKQRLDNINARIEANNGTYQEGAPYDNALARYEALAGEYATVDAEQRAKLMVANHALLKARAAILDLRRAKASGEAAVKTPGLDVKKQISGEVFDKEGRHGAADMPDVPAPNGGPVQLVMPEAPTRRRDAPKEIRESLRSQALDHKRSTLEKEEAANFAERNRLARDPNATPSQIQKNQDDFKQNAAKMARVVMNGRVLESGTKGFVSTLKIKGPTEPPPPLPEK